MYIMVVSLSGSSAVCSWMFIFGAGQSSLGGFGVIMLVLIFSFLDFIMHCALILTLEGVLLGQKQGCFLGGRLLSVDDLVPKSTLLTWSCAAAISAGVS